LDSLKSDFNFKISVLNFARHENERRAGRSRSRKEAESDRLEFEMESLGLTIAYKKIRFSQKRAADTPSNSKSSSDADNAW
jgi:hypothetical protein